MYKNLNDKELVANELEKLVKDNKGYLINNLCFKDEEGYSSEIDHILITKNLIREKFMEMKIILCSKVIIKILIKLKK